MSPPRRAPMSPYRRAAAGRARLLALGLGVALPTVLLAVGWLRLSGHLWLGSRASA